MRTTTRALLGGWDYDIGLNKPTRPPTRLAIPMFAQTFCFRRHVALCVVLMDVVCALTALNIARGETAGDGATPPSVPQPTFANDGLPAPSTTINSSSLADLAKAIDAAKPGDCLVLADGTYKSAAPIVIKNRGTIEHPIVITAQTVGGTEINGIGSFTFADGASYVVVRGFKVTHSPEIMKVPEGADHCRISRCVFELATKGRSPYLQVAGSDFEIDHNEFRNKRTEGEMLLVVGPGTSEMAQHTWIHHNYFHDFRSPPANNCSAIQIGMSGRSMTSAYSLTEHNLFVKCAGENEGCICNKSSDNIYRFNTFGEGSTEVSIRHGNRCQVYANFFIGSQGIRFFGHDHKIYSNYFERCNPAIHIGNGDGVIPPAKLTAHDEPTGEVVAFNTLVNNKTNITMRRRNRGLGADDITVADNIIEGGPQAAALGGPIKNAVWTGNIVWSTKAGAGDIPAEGFISIDPQLAPDEHGEFRLPPSSPAVGAAAGSFPFVTIDVNGLARGSKLDVGAEAPLAGDGQNHILPPADVGTLAVEKERSVPDFAALFK